MPTYDLLMLFVLVATTLFGFWKGMAWQIASIASLVLSYFAALRFSTQLAPVFGDHAPWNRFVAMLAIYIVTSFAIWMLFRLVSGVIDKVKLEAFDRQLGAMFGAAKGVLLCVAITFFAVTLLPPVQGEAIVASRSGHYIIALLNKTHSVVPPEIHQVIDPYLERIESRLDPDFPTNWHENHPESPIPSRPPSSPGTSWPQISWPKPNWLQAPGSDDVGQRPDRQPQVPRPLPSEPRPSGPLPTWPAPTQSTDETDRVPREPNPFPGPYSAERPASDKF